MSLLLTPGFFFSIKARKCRYCRSVRCRPTEGLQEGTILDIGISSPAE